MITTYCILHRMSTLRPIKDFNTLEEAAVWLNTRLVMYGPQVFSDYFLARYDDGKDAGALGGQDLLKWLTSGGRA